jgi:glycine/D-amino acid oxidase-like deaminating enzyme
MPEVIVVGGGIVGTTCAYELARRGATVTLLERDELAAGASGRNLGYLDTSKDPVLAPIARRSLERYREVAAESPTPFFLDSDPIGTLAVTLDEDEVDDLRAWAEAAEAVGVGVERVEGVELPELEPELAPEVLEAYLLDEGHRVDPAALTVAFASLASANGARIRHHLPARRLLERSGRITGVVTDDGVVEADVVVLAAGPWSTAIVRPLGIALRVAGARGWLVHAAPQRPLVHRWIQSGARRLLEGLVDAAEREPDPLVVSVRDFGAGTQSHDVSPMIQPAPDGSILAGTSREPSLATDSYDLSVARTIASQAARLIPALADAPVVATWSGVRPVSPDERPLIGRVLDGLVLATGHGSEGVILGAGSAELTAAIVLNEPCPFDPAPFDPLRFS